MTRLRVAHILCTGVREAGLLMTINGRRAPGDQSREAHKTYTYHSGARIPMNLIGALKLTSFVLTIGTLIVITHNIVLAQQTSAQVTPIPSSEDQPMSDEERTRWLNEIEQATKKREAASTKWDYLYHGSLYGSALLSALAALILQLRFNKQSRLGKQQKNIATVLASLAALLITFNTAGNFNRKWLNHRTNKYALYKLNRYCRSPESKAKTVKEKLDEIDDADRDVHGKLDK